MGQADSPKRRRPREQQLVHRDQDEQSSSDLLDTLVGLLTKERHEILSLEDPSILRMKNTEIIASDGTKSEISDYKCLETVTPKLIAEELYDRASVTYQFLYTLLRKVNDKDDALQKRIGIVTAVIMNLMSQKMSLYATKLGVTLVASD